MANKGVEPPVEGSTDEDGYTWCIDCLGECAKAAEKAGVTLGLENHWGLGRTPEGLLRIVDGEGPGGGQKGPKSGQHRGRACTSSVFHYGRPRTPQPGVKPGSIW
jgi:hypothetical protein